MTIIEKDTTATVLDKIDVFDNFGFKILGEKMPAIIQVPKTAQHLDQVRFLMRSFIDWHRERHVEDIHLIDSYFNEDAFEQELKSLPGSYAPPFGQLLLATLDGAPAGCVALRKIDSDICEMKRMFVPVQFQCQGIGHLLSDKLIKEARSLGYRAIRLDTSVRQNEAKGLYRRLGFCFIEPYYDVSEEMKDWLVFMELRL